MTTLNWKSTVMWTAVSLVFLLMALMVGPAPALAGPQGVGQGVGAVLYEVTEDMALFDANGVQVLSPDPAGSRQATAQLSGFAKVGTPLCPYQILQLTPGAKQCTVNATGQDNLSLATGRGTVKGTYAVVVQGDNAVDAPEFVVMTGTFGGDGDLSPAMAGQAPIGFITSGVGTIDGYPGPAFSFTGKFRLPFALTPRGEQSEPRRHVSAYYLSDAGKPVSVQAEEKSIGFPTVRLEIKFNN